MNKETLNQYLIVAIIYLSIFAFVFSFDDIASIVFAQTTEELPIEVVEPLPELSSDSILKVAIDSIIASSTALTTEETVSLAFKFQKDDQIINRLDQIITQLKFLNEKLR